jgi:hypothetical protein
MSLDLLSWNTKGYKAEIKGNQYVPDGVELNAA